MVTRFGAWCSGGRARGFLRLLVIPAVAAALVLGLTVAADATTSASSVRAGSLTLRTLVRHINVRAAPSLSSRIVGHTGKADAMVVVSCYAAGTVVAGNPVWYHLAKPVRGYITSYYTDTHTDPVKGLVKCGARPVFRRYYHTLGKDLHVRAQPSTHGTAVVETGDLGSVVTVTCFTYGQKVGGDRVWYRTLTPQHGYIAGRHLDTGHDPAPEVPRC
jgi:hypothetical protein